MREHEKTKRKGQCPFHNALNDKPLSLPVIPADAVVINMRFNNACVHCRGVNVKNAPARGARGADSFLAAKIASTPEDLPIFFTVLLSS